MTATDLTRILQQFTRRHQQALLAKAGLLAALGLGVLGLLGWRLHASSAEPRWWAGVPAGLGSLGVAALGWWIRRRWIVLGASAAYLDQTLGLQQRLLTAAEFAGTSDAPTLYPVLVEDAQQQLASQQTRLPRPWDRAAWALLIALFLLFLWPIHGRSPLTQLAKLPPATPPPPSPPPQPPPPQEHERRQERSSASQAGQQGTSGDSHQAQAAGGGQSPEGGGEMGPRPPADQSAAPSRTQSPRGSQGTEQGNPFQSRTGSPQDGRPSGEGQSTGPQGGHEQPRAAGSPTEPTQGRAENSSGSTTAQQASRQSAEDGARQGKHSRADASERRAEGSPRGQQGQSQAGGQRGPGEPQEHAQANPSSGQQGSSERALADQRTGQGAGQASGSTDALKADIQALLKQVSGELQELQAQLEREHGQHQPAAGTGTDPQLYEPPTPLGAAQGAELPIELPTDTAPVSTQRPGGGVGRAGGPAAPASPKTAPEEAQLSEAPAEERAADRQPVPPEYRSVFERLARPHPQPSEAK